MNLDSIIRLIVNKQVNFNWIDLPLYAYNPNVPENCRLTEEEHALLKKVVEVFKEDNK